MSKTLFGEDINDTFNEWLTMAKPFANYYEALLTQGIEPDLAKSIVLNYADKIHALFIVKINESLMSSEESNG